jgi:hypothetical protein
MYHSICVFGYPFAFLFYLFKTMHLSRQGLFVPEEAAPLKKIKDRKHHPSQGDVDQKPHQRRVHQWLLQKKKKITTSSSVTLTKNL